MTAHNLGESPLGGASSSSAPSIVSDSGNEESQARDPTARIHGRSTVLRAEAQRAPVGDTAHSEQRSDQRNSAPGAAQRAPTARHRCLGQQHSALATAQLRGTNARGSITVRSDQRHRALRSAAQELGAAAQELGAAAQELVKGARGSVAAAQRARRSSTSDHTRSSGTTHSAHRSTAQRAPSNVTARSEQRTRARDSSTGARDSVLGAAAQHAPITRGAAAQRTSRSKKGPSALRATAQRTPMRDTTRLDQRHSKSELQEINSAD